MEWLNRVGLGIPKMKDVTKTMENHMEHRMETELLRLRKAKAITYENSRYSVTILNQGIKCNIPQRAIFVENTSLQSGDGYLHWICLSSSCGRRGLGVVTGF